MKTQTNKNFQIVTFLIIILVSMSLTSGKMLNKLASYNKNYAATGTLSSSIEVAKTCLSGMMTAVPPAFCWKKGGDFGKIPTRCPDGYFRFLAMCYANCGPNRHFILGVCYDNCEKGYDNHPLSCYKSLFRWYFKYSRIPHQLTNFSDKIPCDGDMYRFGALCYRNCETIEMFNCGIGACVSDKDACLIQILDMALKVLEGVGTLVTNVVSLGSSTAAISAAKLGAKGAIKALGKAGLQAAKNGVKKAFSGQFKKRLLQKAKNKIKVLVKDQLKDFVKDAVKEAAKTTAIMKICESVMENVTQKTNEDKASVTDTFAENLMGNLDVFGVKGMVDSCSKVGEDGGLGCGKAVVESLAVVDPTGLLTIAAAFIHPTCDVPVTRPPIDETETKELKAEEVRQLEEKKIKQENENVKNLQDPASEREIKEIQNLSPNCVKVFNKVSYDGDSRIDCKSLDLYPLDKFNDRIESFITGNSTNGFFFEHHRFIGRFLRFAPGLNIRDTKSFTHGDLNLKGLISSIHLGDTNIIKFSINIGSSASAKYEEYNYFCNDYPNKTIVVSEITNNNYKINGITRQLYEGKNYSSVQGKVSISLFIYKNSKVTVEYNNNTSVSFEKSTTISSEEIPAAGIKQIKWT